MKLKVMVWAIIPACLLLGAANGYADTCKSARLNETSCQSHQTVRCVKQFEPARGKFIFKWEFVNDSGQVFEAPPKMLGKTPGYTPKYCGLKQNVVAELAEPKPIYRN